MRGGPRAVCSPFQRINSRLISLYPSGRTGASSKYRGQNQGLSCVARFAPKEAVTLLVLSDPATPELSVLRRLPPGATILAVGRQASDFSHLADDALASVDILLVCGVGRNAAKKEDLLALWGRLKGLSWLHSSSAGLENMLFPELVQGPVVLTNARGVYSHSLAEWSLTACNWFAKDLPRLIAAKAERKWEAYDVEELRGKTMGVIGYGDIGASTARLAKAFKMKVVGLRRRVELTPEEVEEGEVDRMYSPDQICDLMAVSDYVVAATPYTPATAGLVSAAAIAAMKPTGVFINVGRGKCVDEEALIAALQQKRIRGAGLDVFATEPLPTESPLWGMDNVLLSPHCADRTKEFQFESLEVFVENVASFMSGKELKNVCDKQKGY